LKKPQDVLREIVEPSRSIDEKYASVILYVNGKIVKGVVVKRTPQQVLLKENPLVNCEPTVVSADEIDEEEKSPLSPMPTGLLNALDQDKILDLLAYVYSGGDPDHALFTIVTAAQP
jgi:putative heme-binding domain-containing protein